MSQKKEVEEDDEEEVILQPVGLKRSESNRDGNYKSGYKVNPPTESKANLISTVN